MAVTELIALGDNASPHETDRVIILRVKKPITFGYVPGQYASVRIASIDRHWHPFSLASEPSQACLEFYITVSTPHSWTAKLWDVAKAASRPGGALPFRFVEVIGPYGTCIDTKSHMHVCGIGAGTGIVPILSALKATVNVFCQINPSSHAAAEAGG